jgi:hypothetical protein
MDTEAEIYKTVSVDFSRCEMCVIDRDKYTTEFLLSFMIQNEGVRFDGL